MKYIAERHEFEFDLNDIINDLPYEHGDIEQDIDKIEVWLRLWNKMIYQYIYKHNTKQNKQYIHYIIYENKNLERDAIKQALIQIVMGAMESDLHVSQYTEHLKRTLPEDVTDYLFNANLINSARFVGHLPSYGVY